MAAHSEKGPSSSHRWMNCPASVQLCEGMPDTQSSYAAEGTEAHLLAQALVNKALGRGFEDPRAKMVYYNQEMQECCEGYRDFVLELYYAGKNPVLLLEQAIQYEKFVKDGYGTADCIIIDDGTLTVVDLKYGLGVGVSAVGNSQIRIYALGALEMFDSLYDIKTIRMIIYQPRRANISEDQMTRDELYDWAENVLKPVALEADEGTGAFAAGEWCRFCKAKNICRERAEKNMELAALDFPSPPLLSDGEIAEILGKVDGLVNWANDVKEYALREAVAGKHWPGYKLVEGRSVRKYKDARAVEKAVLEAGFSPFETTLRPITELEKAMGKRRFNEVLGDLIVKPSGKPTLVPESDPRDPIN